MDPVIALEYGHGDGRYEPVSTGGGAWLPSRFRLHFDDPKRPMRSTLDFAVDGDGGVRIHAVAQEPRAGAGLAPDDFRLPIGRLADVALAAVTMRGPARAPGARLTEHEMLTDAVPSGGLVGEVLRCRRRRVLTPDLLAEVAQVYAQARCEGVRVRAAVAEHWVIPENTARNWISAARRAGLIDAVA